MGSRKENLKKALGITEYPWSSGDEEDNPQTNTTQDAATNRTDQRPTETVDANQLISGTTGSLFSMSPSRRNSTTTRLERDLFWSLLNNPNRSSVSGPSRHYSSPSTSAFEPAETSERADLDNSVANNIHRILTIKRSRNLRPNIYKHSSSRSGGTSRNIIFAPALHADMVRFGRFKRRPMSRVPPAGSNRNGIPGLMSPERRASCVGPIAADEPDAFDSTARTADELAMLMDRDDNDNDNNEETRENDEEMAVPTPEATGDETPPEEDGYVNVVDVDVNEARSSMHLTSNAAQEADPASADDEASEGVTEEVTESTEAQPLQGQVVKRKRESSKDREPESVKVFNQSLLRLLECPVCLEWMEPPMSQCRRGHLVCGRCRARLAACPVCRTAFSSVRNRAMEAVAEMLHYPCRHGCGREMRLRRRASHEASCAARRYRCPAPACAERPPLSLTDLPDHFRSDHLPLMKVGRKHKFSMKVNSEQHDNWLVMSERELFHLRVDVDIRTWGVVVYVAYIGPKCNANNFNYTVTVTGQHNDRKLVYTRATHSDLESSSLNVSRQDCFHLTLDQALNFLRFKNRFCEPDKFLDFVVEINKGQARIEVPTETDVEPDS